MGKRNDAKLIKGLDLLLEALFEQGVQLEGITTDKPINFSGSVLEGIPTFSFFEDKQHSIKLNVEKK